jgi:type III pantothenate kinase
MNLLIDCGNSFIKWALATDESFIIESSCPSKEVLSLHDIWKRYDAPVRVIVSNVAGESIASEIRKIVTSLWELDVEFIVSSKNCCGLTNSYHKPEQLGIDRWMAMVAAYQMTHSTVIVIDCGTAVTIDLVNEKGLYLGGVIMPGLSSAFQSLGADTDAVGVISDTETFTRTTAQSTEEAVQAGVLYGLAGGIERVVREHELLADKAASVFITGGDTESLTPYMRISTILQTDLVLQGLRFFAEKDVLHDR